jgi:hypothetical protein
VRTGAFAFSQTAIESIELPRRLEQIDTSCFYGCANLGRVTFASNSGLQAIGADAFGGTVESGLKMEIPRHVTSIHASAFPDLRNITINAENTAFTLNRYMLHQTAGDEAFVRPVGPGTMKIVHPSVRVIAEGCFMKSSVCSVLFAKGSNLVRIEKRAFYQSPLKGILLPRSVKILGEESFACCAQLSHVSVERCSMMQRIEAKVFHETRINSFLIPVNVTFVGESAFPEQCAISHERWLGLPAESRKSRLQEGLPVSEFVMDWGQFRKSRSLRRMGIGDLEVYQHIGNGTEIEVKNFFFGGSDRAEEAFQQDLSALTTLIHPCIALLYGYSLPTRQACAKIATVHSGGGSLRDVLRERPYWWTVTGKVCAIVGIVHAMKLIHSKGIIHRNLNPDCILFDDAGHVKLSNFSFARQGVNAITMDSVVGTSGYMAPEMFSEFDYTLKVDIFSFALLAYEILVGWPVDTPGMTIEEYQACVQMADADRAEFPQEVILFTKELIRRCWAANPEDRPSFEQIFDHLKKNEFKIMGDEAAPHDIACFVQWIETMLKSE